LRHVRLKCNIGAQQAEEGITRAHNSIVCRGFKTLEMVKLSSTENT
jgi:hypothetical protein